MQAEKALRILGFANRARKLKLGLTATLAAVRGGRVACLVLATDLSQASRSKVEQVAKARNVPILSFGTKAEFGDYFKREDVGVLAVLDKTFTDGMREALDGH